MREAFHCPDAFDKPRPEGMYLPVVGSLTEFPECPAAHLRTVRDVETLRSRYGGNPYAAHLIGGVHHPGTRVSEVAFETENGARSAESLSPKMAEAVHLWFREKATRDAHERDMRKESRS